MTVITFVDFSESTAATIDMPVGIAAGDIAVLHDVAGDVVSPASVYPSGFTAIGTSQTDTSGGIFVRLNVSYKILSGSETTITGMSAGALATYKTLTVYRKTGSYSWNAPASVGAELLVAGGVASKSVVVGTAPLVVIGACWGSSGEGAQIVGMIAQLATGNSVRAEIPMTAEESADVFNAVKTIVQAKRDALAAALAAIN